MGLIEEVTVGHIGDDFYKAKETRDKAEDIEREYAHIALLTFTAVGIAFIVLVLVQNLIGLSEDVVTCALTVMFVTAIIGSYVLMYSGTYGSIKRYAQSRMDAINYYEERTGIQ